MNVSFGAKYLFYENVKPTTKFNGDDSLYFVELNPHNKYDYSALTKISQKWYENSFFIKSIWDEMKYLRYNTPNDANLKTKFYGITTQSEQFNRLNPDKIIGVTQITKNRNGTRTIDFIETNPKYSEPLKDSKLNDMTVQMINFITKLFCNRTINVCATKSEMDSYIKEGFNPTGKWPLKDLAQILQRMPAKGLKF